MVALSTREREVAGLVASGKSNKDIAAVLYLSEKTIESHLAGSTASWMSTPGRR